MASKTQIVNFALAMLAEENVLSINDDIKTARVMRQFYDIALDSILGEQNWSFAMKRAQLAKLADAPAFEFDNQFELPPDCLRVVMIGDVYVGVDLSDSRNAPSREWTIEGRKILTSWDAPLKIRYVQRVTATTMFHPVFVEAFAAKLADLGCESITGSTSLATRLAEAKRSAISKAIRTNAIELPPEKFPDDEWVLSRL